MFEKYILLTNEQFHKGYFSVFYDNKGYILKRENKKYIPLHQFKDGSWMVISPNWKDE